MFRGYRQRQAMLRAWAAHDAATYRAFSETMTSLTGKPLSSLRILDLGCGSNAPMTVLLHAAGCRITGVDAYTGYRWGLGVRPSRYFEYLKEAGPVKTSRKVLGEIVFDRTYYRELARLTGLSLSETGLDLRQMDVERPALPPASFDLIHSNATWEHVSDVAAANRTVANLLVPGGLAYIEIHLFPSLSGGHDLPWIVPGSIMLGNVRPWQHLRDPAWKAPVPLNRLRERDYRRFFEGTAELKLEDWRVEFSEGNEFLTPEILAALPDYDREELTKRSIIVVVRRKQ